MFACTHTKYMHKFDSVHLQKPEDQPSLLVSFFSPKCNMIIFSVKALYGGNTVSIFKCGDMNHLEHQELQSTGARLVISLQSWKIIVGQQYWEEAGNIFFVCVLFNPDIIIVLWAFGCLSLGVCFLFILHHLGYASQSSMNFICDFFFSFGLSLNLWTDQFNFATTEGTKNVHGGGQRPF